MHHWCQGKACQEHNSGFGKQRIYNSGAALAITVQTFRFNAGFLLKFRMGQGKSALSFIRCSVPEMFSLLPVGHGAPCPYNFHFDLTIQSDGSIHRDDRELEISR